MELQNVEIIKIGEMKTFASGFNLVEFVVKTNDEYPQELQLQCSKEKADNLLKFNKVGDKVDVSLNLRGRSWLKDGEPEDNRKWFNTLEAWKVFKSDTQKNPLPAEPFAPAGDLNEDDNFDLPF